MRRSSLGRLFRYSKGALVLAQENFTTEALAAAVSRDADPMVRALCDLARRNATFDRACPEARSLASGAIRSVETQVFLPDVGSDPDDPGYGFLDLVIGLAGGRDLWIEAKVGSQLGAGQLRAYRDAARRRPEPSPAVVSLSKSPLFEAMVDGVAALDWNDLYASVRKGGPPSDRWSDLLVFLEEEDVASDKTMDITDREAGSVMDAFHLFEKVSVVLVRVHHHLFKQWPDYRSKLTWTGGQYKAEQTGAMLNYLGATFRTSGAMLSTAGHIRYGLVEEDGSALWTVAILREGWKQERAAELIRVAASLVSPADAPDDRWDDDASGAIILRKAIRVSRVEGSSSGPEAAVAWFARAFAELADAGVFDVLWPGRAQPPVADQADLTDQATPG